MYDKKQNFPAILYKNFFLLILKITATYLPSDQNQQKNINEIMWEMLALTPTKKSRKKFPKKIPGKINHHHPPSSYFYLLHSLSNLWHSWSTYACTKAMHRIGENSRHEVIDCTQINQNTLIKRLLSLLLEKIVYLCIQFIYNLLFARIISVCYFNSKR